MTMSEHLLELSDIRSGWDVDEWEWRWRQVFVGVETSNCSDVGNVRYLNHCVLLSIAADVLIRRERRKRVGTGVINGIAALIIMVGSILVPIIETMLLEFLWHGGKGDTLWEVGEGIDEASLLLGLVIERASFTELAVARFLPVFAWNGLIVRMDSAKCCFTEILGERIVGLS